MYFIAKVGTAITWSFVVPYLSGMISKLDSSGRLAPLGGLVSKAGLASGPLAAGFILTSGHFDSLIWLAITMLVLSAVAALFAASQVDQLERSPGQSMP